MPSWARRKAASWCRVSVAFSTVFTAPAGQTSWHDAAKCEVRQKNGIQVAVFLTVLACQAVCPAGVLNVARLLVHGPYWSVTTHSPADKEISISMFKVSAFPRRTLMALVPSALMALAPSALMRFAPSALMAPLRYSLMALTLLGLALPAAADDVIARVVSLQGAAQLNSDATVQRGTALRVGDSIVTAPEARARLRFIGGSLLTLGADTELEIARYEPATQTAEQQAHFRVLRGVFLAVAEGVSSADSAYLIETPAATMGIRGTIVWGGYFIPGQADYVLFGGGPVEVFNEQGTVLLTEGGQGTTVRVDADGRPLAEPDAPGFWTPAKVFEATTTIAAPGGQ
ncbi:hypothetical protein E4656_09190 [Natronospirillum operosum]|uniref:FecR protein domain-containing protein n=2 Tax=Natronospirillum operosum TaxID=2759953 RepID=A0A4Z0WA43_9GAMM|nr:hypothetical protein E4656_09190 [Natronospirillum operosum]